MGKHTKLFYRGIARIRAVGEKNGVVYLERIMTTFKTGPVRAVKLKEELVKAGILREWNESDLKKTSKRKKAKGNIIWKNLSKYKIPKAITIKETARVKKERKQGFL